MRITVVDDDLTLLDMMGVLLERAGHDVTTSPGGVAVLPELKRNPPDLVITDLMMAELDGLEFCREIMRDPALNCKVIMISARTDQLWKDRARQAGAIGYIEKPIDPAGFAAQVQEIHDTGE